MLLRLPNRVWNADHTWRLEETAPEVDWSVLDLPNVREICATVARKVLWHQQYGAGQDGEDLEQLAFELAAGVNPRRPTWGGTGMSERTRQHVLAGDLGFLHNELRARLIDQVKTNAKHAHATVSRDERYDLQDEEDQSRRRHPTAPPAQREPLEGYTVELIESLIPGVFDPLYAWGIQAENAPDRDMPRSRSNPATGGVLAAHLADVRRAWAEAELRDEERRALFLEFVLDWRQVDAAQLEGVSQPTISRRVQSGVSAMLRVLGGSADETRLRLAV